MQAVDAEDSGDAVDAAAESGLIVGRLSGGVEYQRPLATGWSGTAGLNWQVRRWRQEAVPGANESGIPMRRQSNSAADCLHFKFMAERYVLPVR